MDLSEYLLGLHKNKGTFAAKDLVPKRIKSAVKRRKNNRYDLLMQRRNLQGSDLDDSMEMETKTEQKTETISKPENVVTDKRKEMLLKWKQQKEMRKMQNKEKRKPIFKVAHAVGFPKVNEALSTIKGKNIDSAKKSSFFLGSAAKTRSTSNLNLFSNSKSAPAATVGINLRRKKLDFGTEKTENVPSSTQSIKKTTENKDKTASKTNATVKSSAVSNVKTAVKASSSSISSVKKEAEVSSRLLTKKRSPVKKRSASVSKNPTPNKRRLRSQKTANPTPKSNKKTAKNASGQEKMQVDEKTRPTEEKTEEETAPLYVSPFVTMSRGKTSARKEYQQKKSPEFNKDNLNASCGPKAGAAYFRFTLDNEIEKLQLLCNVWSTYKEENELPDGAPDMIDVAIGQSQLLIAKKFEQFRGLIDSCENQTGEKPVTCEDLHGFWDMVYMQVVNLNNRFDSLEQMKGGNWEEILPQKAATVKISEPPKKRGRPPKKTVGATSSLREAIKAARAAKMQKKEEEAPEKEMKTFDGGFFKVQSPQKNELKVLLTPARSSKRKSLLSTVLLSENKKRTSIILSVTRSAKKIPVEITALPEKTPGKSILKTDSIKSSNRKSRVVFVDQNLEYRDHEDKENVVLNSQNKDTPRRSERLTRKTLDFDN